MEIVGFVAMSHAPFWDLTFNHKGPGERYVAAVSQARDKVAALAPDVLVVFGPDHFRNFFFDSMPPFCVGAGEVEAFGDYDSPKGAISGTPELGRFVVDHVMEQGFDPAISLNMGVDHGVAQPYAAVAGKTAVSILPIMINCSGAAMASMRRCHAFGIAVGEAVRAAPLGGRVVVVGSGGLSHSPPNGSPFLPDLPADRRDYLINGRSRVAAHSAALDALLAERRNSGVNGPVNAEWDAWFLETYASNDIEPLLQLTSGQLLEAAGPGGQEVRNWIAALGAWNGPVDKSVYEPVPSWITGMGVATAA